MRVNLRNQLKTLVTLAKAFNALDDHEKEWITSLGQCNGLLDDDIENIIENSNSTLSAKTMSVYEKFELLYNTLQLMKSDRSLYFKELDHCKSTAQRLGFNDEIVRELSYTIYRDPEYSSDTTQRELLLRKYSSPFSIEV